MQVLARPSPKGKVSALVLSPTRELARQIQTETHKMLTFHPNLHSMVGLWRAALRCVSYNVCAAACEGTFSAMDFLR